MLIMSNRWTPSGVLSCDNPVYSSTDLEEIEEKLKEFFESGNGGPIMLPKGYKWQQISPPQSLGYEEYITNIAKQIAQVFNVPPLIIGIVNNNHHLSYDSAWKLFESTTVTPLSNKFASALTNWLSPTLDYQINPTKPD